MFADHEMPLLAARAVDTKIPYPEFGRHEPGVQRMFPRPASMDPALLSNTANHAVDLRKRIVEAPSPMDPRRVWSKGTIASGPHLGEPTAPATTTVPEESPEALLLDDGPDTTSGGDVLTEPVQAEPLESRSADVAHSDDDVGGNTVLLPEPGLELRNGGLTLAGGYSTFEGLNVKAALVRSNFPHPGQELTASARQSRLERSFQVGFSDERLFGNRGGASVSLFQKRQKALGFTDRFRDSPFEESTIGANLRAWRKWGSWTASVNYSVSREEFDLARRGTPCNAAFFGGIICSELGRRTSSILSLGLVLDRRDNPILPTKGFRMRLNQDFAGLGGSTRYLRTQAGLDAHFRYGEDWVISVEVAGGLISGFGNERVPLFDRFYLGGPNLRGFDFRGVGPRIRPTAVDARTTAIGGRAYYTARLELIGRTDRSPDTRGIRPSLFVDAGSAFDARMSSLLPGERLLGNSANPRVAVGAGLRLPTPAGSIRVDAAVPVIRQSGDRSQIFSFSVGTRF